MSRNLCILDVGARDGLGEPWASFYQKQIDSILVEPDPIEAKRLKSKMEECSSTGCINMVLPYALWDHSDGVSLNINKSPGTSSVFIANKNELEKYPESSRFITISSLDLPSKTIDQLATDNIINCLDFMKVDVQGGELQVIRGGREFLKNNLIGLEVEVEFLEMYKNQPLFSDVEKYIRTELGLELWDIKKYYWKYSSKKNDSASTKGRVIFADALFFRPLSSLEEWLSAFTRDEAYEKTHMLLLTLSAYGYYDYMLQILESAELKPYLSDKTKRYFTKFLDKNNKQWISNKYKSFLIYKVFYTLAKLFEPNYNGWSAADPLLGNKKKWKFWW